jgi:hypothetical protein
VLALSVSAVRWQHCTVCCTHPMTAQWPPRIQATQFVDNRLKTTEFRWFTLLIVNLTSTIGHRNNNGETMSVTRQLTKRNDSNTAMRNVNLPAGEYRCYVACVRISGDSPVTTHSHARRRRAPATEGASRCDCAGRTQCRLVGRGCHNTPSLCFLCTESVSVIS